MNYEAIVSDFDGTLANAEHTVSLRVQKAVKRWTAAGKSFSVCTGRQFMHIKKVCRLLELTSPQIVRGGSEIVDAVTEDILWAAYINENDCKQLVTLLQQEKIPFHAEKDNYVYTLDGKPLLGYEGTTFLSINDLTYDRIPKILLLDDTLHIEAVIEKKINKQFPNLHVIKSHAPHRKTWDITHKDASKEHATRELANMLGISTKNIVGVGDSYNDAPLLRVCGYKVAMQNAKPELKAVANYIAPANTEDGIAVLIDRLLG